MRRVADWVARALEQTGRQCLVLGHTLQSTAVIIRIASNTITEVPQ